MLRSSGNSWRARRDRITGQISAEIPTQDGGIASNERSFAFGGFSLRWPDDLLRLYAGKRYGQRSFDKLLSLRGDRCFRIIGEHWNE